MTRTIKETLGLRTVREWPPHPDAVPFWIAWSDRFGEDFATGMDAERDAAIEDLIASLIEKGVSLADIWEAEDA